MTIQTGITRPLSDLWLEDLFRIWLRSPEPLDQGPFRDRPTPYNPAAFRNPSDHDVRQVILDKLGSERARGEVEHLGWYIRFVNERRLGVGIDEQRRVDLRSFIRWRRVYVTDPGARTRGLNRLLEALRNLEDSVFQRDSRSASFFTSQDQVMHLYCAPLDGFVKGIWGIFETCDEGLIPTIPLLPVEIDFRTDPHLIRRTIGIADYEQDLPGALLAVDAWNGLAARERAAVASDSSEMRQQVRSTLEAEIERLRGMRHINYPCYLPAS